jgi:hypothetical protein
MAVSVENEPIFKPGEPEILFRGSYFTYDSYGTIYTPWDIHPDGKRFLMLKPSAITDDKSNSSFPRKINIVLNWFEELKERVPVD